MDLPRFAFSSLQLDPQRLALFAAHALMPFLSRQRWFGMRHASVRSVAFEDVLPVPGSQAPLALAIATIQPEKGPAQHWQLVLSASDPRTVDDRDAIAIIELPDKTVCVHDALRSEADCEQLVSALLGSPAWVSARGRCAVEASQALRALAQPLRARALGADQSNTSVLIGQGAVLKLFRRVEPGPNPDVEIPAFLSSIEFPHVPRLLGQVFYSPDAGGPIRTLAAFQEYVPNEGDGWNDALRELHATFDDPSGPRIAAYAARARDLGVTTGRMHRALSRGSSPDFAPETIERADLERWYDRMVASLRRVAGELDHRTVQAVEDVLLKLPSVPAAGMKCRIHGDLHLGQVLQAPGRWVVFDFEGEPMRPLSERREKHSPLRDVAGMLRSFDYAAHAGLSERARQPGSQEWKRLEPIALRWESSARDAFVAGWLSALDNSPLVPADQAAIHLLLDVFELEKALYELGYELAHRPDWVAIPMHGIGRILERRR